jgi:hypothetical protein
LETLPAADRFRSLAEGRAMASQQLFPAEQRMISISATPPVKPGQDRLCPVPRPFDLAMEEWALVVPLDVEGLRRHQSLAAELAQSAVNRAMRADIS